MVQGRGCPMGWLPAISVPVRPRRRSSVWTADGGFVRETTGAIGQRRFSLRSPRPVAALC